MDWTIDPGMPLNGQKPHWLSLLPIAKIVPTSRDYLVEGLWRTEEVLLLGGHAKSWKSWAEMDLMYCISNGLGWLAWPNTCGGRVLYVDLELFDYEIRKRLELIAESHGIGNLDNIDVLSLRGYTFTLNDFSSLSHYIDPGDYVAISIDPTYRMLSGSGLSESDSGVITDLMNRALELAKKLGAGVNLLQHFSKGSQADKRALEAFSGSGVWGRAPDSCLTFREHADERCYTVSADLRHWPHMDPFVAEFIYPRFQLQGQKDPENLKTYAKRTGRPAAFSVEDLCNLVEDAEYISYTNLLRRSNAASATKRTFDRRLKEAKTAGYLATNPGDSTYFLTSTYVSKFRES